MPLFNSGLLAAADHEALIAAIVFVITIVSWLVNLLSNKGRKVPPVANRPRPPVRPREDKLQEEISIFMQEATGRKPAAARPPRPAAKPTEPARRPPVPPKKPPRRSKPGAEIESRQAPVTGTLGTGVKQHLNQYMADKVAQQVQQRLAPRLEERLAEDLGAPVTTGAARPLTPAPPVAPTGASRADRLADALRNPASLRQAIVLNLVLSPPPARSGARTIGTK